MRESKKQGPLFKENKMRNFKDLIEKQGDTAIFCIGRFNPPTTGHLKMIEAAAAQKSKYAGAPFYVFPTHSQDPAKNPLPHALKVAYMKKMFKKYAKNIQVSKARNVFEMAVILHDKGHRAIVLVAGSDRVDEFDKLLNQYNGVEGRHGYYGFDSIEVVSAGERDPDAEGVEGMSASKMRAAAATGDFDNFKLGLPSGFKDDKKLFRDVRKNMGIREERDMGNMDDYETLRDAYLTGKIWNIDDLVESNGIEGRIVNKGTNYLAYMDGSGKVHKAWLHDIALNERNYAKEYANYAGRPEQIARRSSRNKARRAMGDKVVKGMDVGHRDNNPMNNDPKNLRNEDPSVNRREPRLREEDNLDEAFPVQVTVKDKKGKTHTIGTRDLRGATHALLIHYKEISPVKGNLPGSKETKPAKTEIFLGTEGELAKTAKRMLKQHPSKKYATGAEVVKLDQKMVKGATLSETNEWGELTEKAEYDGRPVDLNNPTEGDRKKYKVYVRNDKGNVVKVEFGDPNMEIKRDSPGRLKAFRARHQCDTNPGPKWKARYWSCKFWEKGKTVTDLMKG